VPATQAPPLPPVDPEANALITQMFQRYPEAAYRMTQLAFVQEQGLIQAQNRIQQLEAQVAQARQAAQEASTRQQGGGGFFSNLFGGGSRQQQQPPPNPGPWGGQQGGPRPGYAPPPGYAQQPAYAPPPPQYAPGYQPGMFQSGGSGFLGSALTTAAGVAGGMVVGNLLTNMFTGGHHGGGWGGPVLRRWWWPVGSARARRDRPGWPGTVVERPRLPIRITSTTAPGINRRRRIRPGQTTAAGSDSGGSWDSGGGDSAAAAGPTTRSDRHRSVCSRLSYHCASIVLGNSKTK